MGDLLIRNVPEALKRDIAERAERNGTSLSDEAKELLRRAMTAKDRDEEKSGAAFYNGIRRAFLDAGASGDEFAEILDEVEAERKKDFGRPFEGFE